MSNFARTGGDGMVVLGVGWDGRETGRQRAEMGVISVVVQVSTFF